MTQDGQYPRGPGSGEHWNVNMPAIIGVIVVLLIGVVVWVVVGENGGDDAVDTPATTLSPAPESTPATVSTSLQTSLTTTPAPMPSVPATSLGETSTTEVSVTTAPGADPGAVPGDLGIAGRPMQQPPCDDAYITVLASAVGAQATADGVGLVLESFDGSNYLRTDQTCPSLAPDLDGEPIYVVYFGPFAFDTDACAARADGPEGAYARQLSKELGPEHFVTCI